MEKGPETVPLQTVPLNSGPQPGGINQNAPPGQYPYNPAQQPTRPYATRPPGTSSNRKIVFIGLGIYCAIFLVFIIIFLVVFFTVFNKVSSEIEKHSNDYEEARRSQQEFENKHFGNRGW